MFTSWNKSRRYFKLYIKRIKNDYQEHRGEKNE